MATVQAHIRTDRAARYLAQLCEHAAHLGALHHGSPHDDDRAPHRPRRVEGGDTEGVISFDRGRCILLASAQELVLVAEADDDEALRLIQNALTERVELIGRRDHLKVAWEGQPPE
jgi:hypothetical protein